MRVTVVDPPAYTPPYDHALCSALARRGIDVELVTSRFSHGSVPSPDGYRRELGFYRLGAASRVAKGLQHPLDMARLARSARRRSADVVHFQWLPIPELDRLLVRGVRRPWLVTAHDIVPRGAGSRRARAARESLAAADAVIVHSDTGRRRLVDDLRLPPDSVHVVPHGAFDYLTRLPDEIAMDPSVGPLEDRRVVLFFGLLRPHKGLDVLIEAFARTPDDAVLLVIGRAMMPVEPLRDRARSLGIGERVRFVTRFVNDQEIPPYFRRADLVVLPYREIDQSGVLYTALAFGSPLVLTAVGGFVEVEQHGAARLVPPGDAGALGATLVDLLDDDAARAALGHAAAQAASGPYSWDRAAELTDGLYRALLERSR